MKFEQILKARERIKDKIKYTPVVSLRTIGDDAYIKMESLQVTGSFKIRGALNKILTLTDEELKHGVIACSAGNHAQGVAKSARDLGVKSVICIPTYAPISKIEATRKLGAEVVLVPTTFDDAKQRAYELEKEKGYTFIHPFNDEEVIAGQGTIGIEIMEQLPLVDIVVVPIGGGGLISGIALAIKSINPKVKVIGVQASTAGSMYQSLKEDKVTTLNSCKTIADGIAVKTPGDLCFEIVKEYVDDVVLVSEGEISGAILALMEDEKIVSEGAAAATVAALMYNKFDAKGKKVLCLLSGGNIDVQRISKVIEKGLYTTKRALDLRITLQDSPGELNKLLKVFEELGANIQTIDQVVDLAGEDIDTMWVRVKVATRDANHQEEIKSALIASGYKLH